ncbi:hypothetical protein QTP88_001522 [Uroleucon formosanum]
MYQLNHLTIFNYLKNEINKIIIISIYRVLIEIFQYTVKNTVCVESLSKNYRTTKISTFQLPWAHIS